MRRSRPGEVDEAVAGGDPAANFGNGRRNALRPFDIEHARAIRSDAVRRQLAGIAVPAVTERMDPIGRLERGQRDPAFDRALGIMIPFGIT